MTLGLILFAYSTILGWAYYGERCMERLFGRGAVMPYRVVFVFVGATVPLALVWTFAGVMNGLMALPNLVGLLVLSGLIARETQHYLRNDPRLRASSREIKAFMRDRPAPSTPTSGSAADGRPPSGARRTRPPDGGRAIRLA